MNAASWRRHIGDDAFNHIAGHVVEGQTTKAEVTAAILTAAVELGFTVPAQAPKIDPAGTRVFWPGGVAAMTSTGLIRHYAIRGQGFYVLRVRQLLRALGGPLLPRWQEIAMAYEAQCEIDGVDPVPDGTPGCVVGGEGPVSHEWLRQLVSESPEPRPELIRVVTVAGPG